MSNGIQLLGNPARLKRLPDFQRPVVRPEVPSTQAALPWKRPALQRPANSVFAQSPASEPRPPSSFPAIRGNADDVVRELTSAVRHADDIRGATMRVEMLAEGLATLTDECEAALRGTRAAAKDDLGPSAAFEGLVALRAEYAGTLRHARHDLATTTTAFRTLATRAQHVAQPRDPAERNAWQKTRAASALLLDELVTAGRRIDAP
jgi:hypothetical protein